MFSDHAWQYCLFDGQNLAFSTAATAVVVSIWCHFGGHFYRGHYSVRNHTSMSVNSTLLRMLIMYYSLATSTPKQKHRSQFWATAVCIWGKREIQNDCLSASAHSIHSLVSFLSLFIIRSLPVCTMKNKRSIRKLEAACCISPLCVDVNLCRGIVPVLYDREICLLRGSRSVICLSIFALCWMRDIVRFIAVFQCISIVKNE